MSDELKARADRLLALRDKATPGPWTVAKFEEVVDDWLIQDESKNFTNIMPITLLNGVVVAFVADSSDRWKKLRKTFEGDASLISAVHDMADLIRDLLAEVERLRGELQTALAASLEVGQLATAETRRAIAAEAENARLRGGAVPVGVVTEHDSHDHNGHQFMVIEWNHDMLPVGTELYTAPPAPAVPDAIEESQVPAEWQSDHHTDNRGAGYEAGWNACRAAMLAAAPEPPK